MINRECNEKKKKKKPVVVTQASPLGHQEIQDHEQLPLTFWFGGWSAVLMVPTGFPFIILEECGFIMSDKDKVT